MKNIKAVAGVLVIFILGAIFGGGATTLFSEHVRRACHPAPQHREDSILRHLTAELALDKAQRDAIDVLLKQTGKKIECTQCQAKADIEASIEATHKAIATLLRPEQKAKFLEIVAKEKARHRRPHPFLPPHGQHP